MRDFLSDERRVQAGEALLLPVRRMRIGRQHVARGVERGDLVVSERPADRAERLAELFLIARPAIGRASGRGGWFSMCRLRWWTYQSKKKARTAKIEYEE